MSAASDIVMVRFKKTSATYLEETAMLLSKLIRSSKAIDTLKITNGLFSDGYASPVRRVRRKFDISKAGGFKHVYNISLAEPLFQPCPKPV